MPLPPVSPPAGFKYRHAFACGRPKHLPADAFSLKHPAMDLGRRSKIFAPFDALRGFRGAVTARETRYEPFREIDEDRMDLLNRKFARLLPLVRNSRAARENRVRVEVVYFCPCDDPDSEHYGILGRYRTCGGLLKRIDPVHGQLLLDDRLIDLDDIYDIRGPEGLPDEEDEW